MKERERGVGVREGRCKKAGPPSMGAESEGKVRRGAGGEGEMLGRDVGGEGKW